MINHNILGIIGDKVALIQWKEKMQRVNEFYAKYFRYCDNNIGIGYLAISTKTICCSCLYIYNYRSTYYQYYTNIQRIKIETCFVCGNTCFVKIPTYKKLPKYYW